MGRIGNTPDRRLVTSAGTNLLKAEVVPASEEEIAVAICVLKARSRHFPLPREVQQNPFNEKLGWRLAAIAFIEQNLEDAAAGRAIIL